MLKENKLTYGIKVFENPILDKLSRIHPAVPALTWGPAAIAMFAYGIYVGAEWQAAWLFPLGVLVWTFTEYVLHRFFFHWEPKSPRLKKMMYYVHEHHHQYQEWDRLVAPPLMSVPIFLIFLGPFWLIFGDVWLWPFLAGWVVGYLAYDYVHFYTHFAKPKSALGKMLRKRHYQHHFARPDRWYGISNQLWDFVFGTHMRKNEKSINANANNKKAAMTAAEPAAAEPTAAVGAAPVEAAGEAGEVPAPTAAEAEGAPENGMPAAVPTPTAAAPNGAEAEAEAEAVSPVAAATATSSSNS